LTKGSVPLNWSVATAWINPLKFKHIGLILKGAVAFIRKNTNGGSSYSLYWGWV
jgi:hypothetical protein